VKAYILFGRDQSLEETRRLLVAVLEKDSTRIDIIQEVGKICYFMRDYDSAYEYYKIILDIREANNLNIYIHENAKIGNVFLKTKKIEEADRLFNEFREFAEQDKSIYKHLNLAMFDLYKDDDEKAIEEIRLFSQEDNYQYWILLFLEIDPLLDSIKDLSEFKEIMKVIENKFWDQHNVIRATLEEKDLI